VKPLPRLVIVAGVAASLGARLLFGATTFTFSTVAGSPGTVVNSADGTGADAQFDAPRGVAVDSAGVIYVADATNNTIRRVTSSGVVTTLAGTAGTHGYADGTGAAARFNEPFGVAVDNAGNVYVADTSNNAIRKITPAGVVTTLAGGGAPGATDGTGTAARLHEPRGIAIDSAGTLYVADYENEMIRKITPAGVVTTLAGKADVAGDADGVGTNATFRAPMGIAVDTTGVVYVADGGNRAIRRISADGTVTTVATTGSALSQPRGVAVDANGVLYVADYESHSIRSIARSGAITTLAGTITSPGTADGTGSAARFHYPSAVAVSAGGAVHVADTENDTVRVITTGGAVTTVAGRAGRTSVADGVGAAARFEDPFAVAADANGIVYVADSAAHVIRKVSPTGEVTTYAGTPGSFGGDDGTGFNARFYSPFGVAVDSAGTVYVADSYNSTVRKIALGGVVTTLAGVARQRGAADGTGAAARFDQPFGIAVDASGTVYVSDASANVIRKITPAGVVTTLAGGAGNAGSTDGAGAAARFTVPYGVACDTAGTVYVVDHGNHTIRKITPAGVVTTLAGTAGSAGNTDATGAAARFRYPSSIAADRSGTVFVADTDNQIIREISPAGVVTTAGGSGGTGSTDGVGTAAKFFNPKGIAVDPSGTIYIADRRNHTIRRGTR
jgi:sugar lactone lactonase YvrE